MAHANCLGQNTPAVKSWSKAKDGEKERLNDGNNNGQATHGARKHAWRTQGAWAKKRSPDYKSNTGHGYKLPDYLTTWLCDYQTTWLKNDYLTWIHATWLPDYLTMWLPDYKISTWLKNIYMTTNWLPDCKMTTWLQNDYLTTKWLPYYKITTSLKNIYLTTWILDYLTTWQPDYQTN